MTLRSQPSTSQTKPSIALFGGAFDPITLGHEAVAMAVYQATGFHVWLLPAWKHRWGKNMTDYYHRSVMCTIVSDHSGIPLSNCHFERDVKNNGSTYELIGLLKQRYKFRFHIIVGTDNIDDIWTKWDRGRLLLKENPFIFVGRAGYRVTQPIPFDEIEHIKIPSEWDCSSTMVRNAIASGDHETMHRNINSRVWYYIMQNKLYGYKE